MLVNGRRISLPININNLRSQTVQDRLMEGYVLSIVRMPESWSRQPDSLDPFARERIRTVRVGETWEDFDLRTSIKTSTVRRERCQAGRPIDRHPERIARSRLVITRCG